MDVSPQFMPALPKSIPWTKQPLNPSGSPKDLTPQERDAPFGLHFMTKLALRDIVVQRDLLVQFAQLVASAVNATRDKYVPAAMENDLLESMILNVAAANIARAAAQSKDNGSTLPSDILEKMRDRVAEALRGSIGAGAASATPPMSEGTRTQIETLFQASQDLLMRERAAKGPGAPPPPTVPTSSLSFSAAPPPRPSTTGPPSGPPPSFSILPPGAKPAGAAAAARAPAFDAKLAYAYLLFRGNATSTEMELIKKIFDLQEPLSITPNRDLLNLMQQLEHMLHRHQPGNWFLSPLNLGTVFFSYELKAAVERAIRIVRDVCGQPDAIAIDLMTQMDTRVPFADLTALQISTTSLLVRYGGGKSGEEMERARRLKALQWRFRDMMRVWRNVEGRRVQSWTFPEAGYTYYQRMTDMANRRNAMDTRGEYYSDIPKSDAVAVERDRKAYVERFNFEEK